MNKIEETFNEIYEDKKWGVNFANMGSSGPGSNMIQAREYMEYLQVFIHLNKIKSITDVGCGDFQFMRHVNLKNIRYLGVDCVKSLIKYNNKTFGNEKNIVFKYKELSKHTL
jgi:hypothetical protein